MHGAFEDCYLNWVISVKLHSVKKIFLSVPHITVKKRLTITVRIQLDTYSEGSWSCDGKTKKLVKIVRENLLWSRAGL